MSDNVKHPSHYCKSGMECIDAIKSAVSTITDPFEAYCTGNIIKYIWRWHDKNGIEDLHKAVQYIEFVEQYRASKQSADTFDMGEEDVSEPEYLSSGASLGKLAHAMNDEVERLREFGPVKGKYERLSDDDLFDVLCNAANCDCQTCPISHSVTGKSVAETCTNMLYNPAEFRKIAIKWLEEQDE